MFSSKKRKAVDNSKDKAADKFFSERVSSFMKESQLRTEEIEAEKAKREEKERLQFEATYGKFSLWADIYFTKEKLNTYLGLRGAVDQFRKDTPYKWNLQYFKKNVEEWCKAKKYEVDPPESIGQKGKCHDDLAKYYEPTFFIKTNKTENNG